MKGWGSYSVAAVAVVLAVFLWLVVLGRFDPPSRRSVAPVTSAVPSAFADTPLALDPGAAAAVGQAVDGLKRRELASMARLRADSLRDRGLSPPRALRDGERCVGGTVVAYRMVSGVPTYTQVVESGLRVACE